MKAATIYGVFGFFSSFLASVMWPVSSSISGRADEAVARFSRGVTAICLLSSICQLAFHHTHWELFVDEMEGPDNSSAEDITVFPWSTPFTKVFRPDLQWHDSVPINRRVAYSRDSSSVLQRVRRGRREEGLRPGTNDDYVDPLRDIRANGRLRITAILCLVCFLTLILLTEHAVHSLLRSPPLLAMQVTTLLLAVVPKICLHVHAIKATYNLRVHVAVQWTYDSSRILSTIVLPLWILLSWALGSGMTMKFETLLLIIWFLAWFVPIISLQGVSGTLNFVKGCTFISLYLMASLAISMQSEDKILGGT